MTSVSEFLYPLASQIARPNKGHSAIYPDSEIAYRRLRVPSRSAKLTSILPRPVLTSNDGSCMRRSKSRSRSRSNSIRLSSQAAANSLKRVFSRRRRRAAEVLFGQELEQLDDSQMARLDSELNAARIEMGLEPIFDSSYVTSPFPRSASSTLRSKGSESLSRSLSQSLSRRTFRERRAAKDEQNTKPAPAVLRIHKLPGSAEPYSEKVSLSSSGRDSTISLRCDRNFGSKRIIRAYEYDEQSGIKRFIHACKRVFTRLPKNGANYFEATYGQSVSLTSEQGLVEPVTIPEPCYLRPGKTFGLSRSNSGTTANTGNRDYKQQHYFYNEKTPESPLSKYLRYQSSSLAASSVYSSE